MCFLYIALFHIINYISYFNSVFPLHSHLLSLYGKEWVKVSAKLFFLCWINEHSVFIFFLFVIYFRMLRGASLMQDFPSLTGTINLESLWVYFTRHKHIQKTVSVTIKNIYFKCPNMGKSHSTAWNDNKCQN